MITGGMPEIVEDYITSNASKMEKFEKIRIKQNELLTAYRGDFAKYSGKVHANSIISVFESIPAQLAKDNKRFIASKVEGEGRFSKLKSSIDWLLGAGLLIQVKITNRGELPLSAFTKDNLFKLYFFDTGLLGALGGLSPKAIYLEQNLFATYKGAFCENFIAQEFTASEGNKLYSWMNNTSEVEFLREIDGELFPIEVKAGLSGKLKSLNVYVSKYNPPYRTRFSARNLEINHQSQMHSYPLYLAGRFPLSASTPE
ncbi:MAG: DUF4143 domain-containing protein [Spirochaetales bacterium]|nr:DUF4143 domain-containing protein [Spirochaetales bacterium]